MELRATNLDDLFVLNYSKHRDGRGEFYRMFCDQELAQCLQGRQIRQINHSQTQTSGTLRGMHYQQPPHAEMKIVQCIRGSVFDVAIDLRKNSSTCRQWYGIELSAHDNLALVIPEHFAHGFQTLQDDTELIYFHTSPYVPEAEAGIRFDDPIVGVEWPCAPVSLSERDSQHPFLDNNFSGI